MSQLCTAIPISSFIQCHHVFFNRNFVEVIIWVYRNELIYIYLYILIFKKTNVETSMIKNVLDFEYHKILVKWNMYVFQLCNKYLYFVLQYCRYTLFNHSLQRGQNTPIIGYPPIFRILLAPPTLWHLSLSQIVFKYVT